LVLQASSKLHCRQCPCWQSWVSSYLNKLVIDSQWDFTAMYTGCERNCAVSRWKYASWTVTEIM
jgi:hypothetical protein